MEDYHFERYKSHMIAGLILVAIILLISGVDWLSEYFFGYDLIDFENHQNSTDTIRTQ